MKKLLLFFLFLFCLVFFWKKQTTEFKAEPFEIHVDLNQQRGALKPVWAWFGCDEPNYTYMKDGQKLLSELANLSPVPVYLRTHNLMTSGDGTPALKWGSTDMYSEDSSGNPVYNWKIVDQIFDSYIQLGMKPLAQIGFMPKALSAKPEPYQHSWAPGKPYQEIMTGWAYPPKDYDKWADLISAWVRHCVERYGQVEVESWYWELWNEPDGFYLISPNNQETFFKMYDYAAFAVKRALPTARFGGPHTARGGTFLKNFLEHTIRGQNYVTGKIGSPLDFVAFHAKGQPNVINGRVQMGMGRHFQNISEGFSVIASFPELKNTPVILGESDPEGCAACGVKTNPENAYRNGTLYSSYLAASVARLSELAEEFNINLIGAVNWSFEFEGQPWFAGYRDLATNGINKPVLNVLKMFGMMTGDRVAVTGDFAYNSSIIRAQGVRGLKTDLNALASAGKNSISILLWNYHDDDFVDQGTSVQLNILGINSKELKLTHYQVDQENSNSYTAWKRMGSPQQPTSEQISILEHASKLAVLPFPKTVKVKNKTAQIEMNLPRQAVALVQIELLN